MVFYCGIDNGLNGGIVVINDKQEIVVKYIMPVIKGEKTEFNFNEIANIFNYLNERFSPEGLFVCLEKAHVRPVQGIRSAFTTGLCLGMFQGVLASNGISYEVINPTVWMKKVFEGHKTEDKKASVQWCQKKWPKEVWTSTERSKKIHDGLTDAACMAYYMFLKYPIGVVNE